MPTTNVSAMQKSTTPAAEPFWPNSWWKLMEMRVGVVPLPIYFLLVALIAGFVYLGALPTEIVA